MKVTLAFALTLLIASCSSESSIERRRVVLKYGVHALSAKIQEDGTFRASKESPLETMDFSGTVREQEQIYRIDLSFSRQVKSSNDRTELSTTITLMANDSSTVGGVNDVAYVVSLE